MYDVRPKAACIKSFSAWSLIATKWPPAPPCATGKEDICSAEAQVAVDWDI